MGSRKLNLAQAGSSNRLRRQVREEAIDRLLQLLFNHSHRHRVWERGQSILEAGQSLQTQVK